jgi:phospholipase C
MNGFVQNANNMFTGFGRRVMSAFRPEVVSSLTALVHEFALFDRWFAAVPSSTQPNRLFIHSATSHGATWNDHKVRSGARCGILCLLFGSILSTWVCRAGSLELFDR